MSCDKCRAGIESESRQCRPSQFDVYSYNMTSVSEMSTIMFGEIYRGKVLLVVNVASFCSKLQNNYSYRAKVLLVVNVESFCNKLPLQL